MIAIDPSLSRAPTESSREESRGKNEALCGAQHSFSPATISGEAQAGQDVAPMKVKKLSLRQSHVAAMLATGMNIAQAAEESGVSRATIFRWRQRSAAFRREQVRCAEEAAAELSTSARRLLVKATGYINRVMEDSCAREDWAARILRNRRLWELAMPQAEE